MTHTAGRSKCLRSVGVFCSTPLQEWVHSQRRWPGAASLDIKYTCSLCVCESTSIKKTFTRYKKKGLKTWKTLPPYFTFLVLYFCVRLGKRLQLLPNCADVQTRPDQTRPDLSRKNCLPSAWRPEKLRSLQDNMTSASAWSVYVLVRVRVYGSHTKQVKSIQSLLRLAVASQLPFFGHQHQRFFIVVIISPLPFPLLFSFPLSFPSSLSLSSFCLSSQASWKNVTDFFFISNLPKRQLFRVWLALKQLLVL